MKKTKQKKSFVMKSKKAVFSKKKALLIKDTLLNTIIQQITN